MSLPILMSPKRRERSMRGVSNKDAQAAHPRRLCQLDDPRAAVDAEFMANINDQRHLQVSMVASTVKHAPQSRHFSVPPALPASGSMLNAMRARATEHAHLSSVRPPQGIPGLLGAGQATGDARFRAENARAMSSPAASTKNTPRKTYQRDAARDDTSTAITGEPSAAQTFMRSENLRHGSLAGAGRPMGIPAAPARPTRNGTHRPDETMAMTQPNPRAGQYGAAGERFDANTRGLNVGLVLQRAKLEASVARDVKSENRRNQAQLVVVARDAHHAREDRVTAGRLKARTAQFTDYKDRIAKYKFTR
jgi:hypothetical protein